MPVDDVGIYTDRTSFFGFVGLQSDTAASFGMRKPKTRVQRESTALLSITTNRVVCFMKTLITTFLAIGLVAGTAFNLAAEELDGAKLYMTKTCFSCHGKDAKTPILPIYPKVAGQNPDYAYNQMLDIKSGARSNGQTAAMKGIMHLVSDEELRAIADWLGSLQ